ncbi:beta-galactosidase [Pseudomonas sp. S75]|uniref:beta-galactosidase n=1 Tax=unclassified Pseudomonas TaxID=196821 RepID=UPI001903C874|nr:MULTISPECIES: beta-galactosidase [unclassified Pseudomonas]MBJ9975943.1 beta-galactosidase [Pseudomonas sp. S30]MBK0153635.1 beta-galactosidase [Pseudomonas sp. S75]
MIRRTLPVILTLLCSSSVLAEQQTLFSFVRPTSLVTVTTEDTSMPQYNAEQTAEGEVLRRVVFNPVARPTLRLSPQGSAWNWSGGKFLALRLQSAQDWALTVDLTITGSDGRRLTSRIDLPAGPAQTVMVPLQARSPLSQGMRAGPPMPWIYEGQRLLLTSSSGEVDLTQVASLSLSIPQPRVAQNLLVERVGLESDDRAERAAYAELIDAYGQSTRGRWPEKVANDEQLKAADAREQVQLKRWLAEREAQQLDAYGGTLAGQAFEAKGFFRTEKRDGRWYLVTPEGHPFYSLGVNAVAADAGRTYVAGREGMFKGLPTQGDPLSAFYGEGNNDDGNASSQGRAFKQGRWYDFYAANLQRTYGATCPPVEPDQPTAACPAPQFDAERWQAHSLDRLLAWGFNTLGNWSDPALSEAERMPYTLPLSIVGDYASISTGMDWWGRMPDPFDPRFAMATERAVAIATRDHRDDPWLIGYFADNELAWAAPGDDPKARYGLAFGTLRLTTDVPAKRAFLKQLRDKYRNQEGLSKAWGIELKAWELMEDPGFEAPLPNPEHPEIKRDYQYFQQVFAQTYFKTISDALKWHAPNHLLLGGRYAISTPEAVKACAEFCDVISFNFYTLKPEDGYDFSRLAELDKPVLVSEFQFGSRDRGPFWPGPVEVPREEDRGPAYANFLKAAMAQPMIVGAHWFQYLDQPASGRLLDGENGHLGLVAITDMAYPGFVDAVRKSNRETLDQLRKTLEKKRPN